VQGEKVTGRVSVVDKRGVTLEIEGQPLDVSWADLGAGRMQVEFSRATTPDGPDALGEER
jgi:ribosome maturation factor RimP